MTGTHIGPATRMTAGLLMALVGACVGCAGSSRYEVSGPVKPLSAADFRGEIPATVARGEPIRIDPAVERDDLTVTRARPAVLDAAARGPSDVVAYAGPPTDSTEMAGPPASGLGVTGSANAPTSAAIVVDELVGQINGKPVYATEFYADMDQRLRRQASQMPPREWIKMVTDDTKKALIDKMRDELLLAEFQASLTPDTRRGFLAFVEAMRQDILSENKGSESVANERLESASGRTVDEEVRFQTDRGVVSEQYRRSVLSKVHVSQRDVRRYYEQNPDKFGAKSEATLRIVRVPLTDEERLTRVSAAMQAGDSFEDIAVAESDHNKTGKGIYTVKVGAGGYSNSKVFEPKPLNEAAVALAEGEATPRIDYDGNAWWIKLEKLDVHGARSLYEVQLEVEDFIRQQRLREEEQKYFQMLISRASVSNEQAMYERLVRFAVDRYLGAGTSASIASPSLTSSAGSGRPNG